MMFLEKGIIFLIFLGHSIRNELRALLRICIKMFIVLVLRTFVLVYNSNIV